MYGLYSIVYEMSVIHSQYSQSITTNNPLPGFQSKFLIQTRLHHQELSSNLSNVFTLHKNHGPPKLKSAIILTKVSFGTMRCL